MRFLVRHATRYDYCQPVFLEPHAFRLRPRSNSWQRVDRFLLRVEPAPAILTETSDSEGNDLARAWFSQTTDSLLVRSEFELETLRENPFDYILVGDAANRLPLRYSEELRVPLAPYMTPASRAEGPVREFARSVAEWAGGETLPFLAVLNERIFSSYEVVVREKGEPLTPEQTLLSQQAACRDLAALFIEGCRLQGVAARFVSGYGAGDDSADVRYMHAWAEVYLPGGGWRGYDPARGLAVADRHVAVAASATPRLAAPIAGTFRGTGVVSSMEAEIAIQTESR